MASDGDETAKVARSRPTLIVLATVLAMIGVGALFLAPYLTSRVNFPVGNDTKKYIWRATLAADQGLDAIPGSAPAEFEDNPDRPGYPALASTVWGVLGIDPTRLAEVLPAVMAVVIGLGAGVLAVQCLGNPRWAFPIFVLVVGASMQVVRTAVGYADNLLVDGVLMGAAVAVTLTPRSRRGSMEPFSARSLGAAGFLVIGAAAIHWIFALLFVAMLAVIAALRTPSSLQAHRDSGVKLLHTEAGRLASLVFVGITGGFVALAVGPSLPTILPSPASLTEKFNEFIPRFSLSITASLAGVGAILILLAVSRERWRAVLLTLLWASIGLAAVFAFNQGELFAAYRVLGFALGIPLLGAVAIVYPGRLGKRFGTPGLFLASVVMAIGIFLSVGAANNAWNGDDPVWIDRSTSKAVPLADKIAQIETVQRYLTSVAWTGPVVFVDNTRTATTFQLIRALMPADFIPRTFFYLGDTQTLLAGQPTLIEGDDEFNEKSLMAWTSVKAALQQDAVLVQLSTTPASGREEVTVGFPISEQVTIVRGPTPETRIAPAKVHLTPSSPWSLTWRTVATLALLLAAGLGWTFSLMEMPWGYRIALAPAFGIATLALGGVIGSRFGAPLSGPPVRIITFIAVTAGWVPLIIRETHRRELARTNSDAASQATHQAQVTDTPGSGN